MRNKLNQLSTSAPYNNGIHINIKMTASYIYNKGMHKYKHVYEKQKWWGKWGKGIECKWIMAF